MAWCTVIHLMCAAAIINPIFILPAWATAHWFWDQNRCMFNSWEAQRSAEWRESIAVCNSLGWNCCWFRIRAEQAGFNRCLSDTVTWFTKMSPIVLALAAWASIEGYNNTWFAQNVACRYCTR